MEINIYLKNKEYYDDAQLLARSFFVRANVNHFESSESRESKLYEDKVELFIEDMTPSSEEEMRFSRGELHDIFKKRIYDHLRKLVGRDLPWGFLTGVRPSKRAMSMLENGHSDNEIREKFQNSYMVSNERAVLALEIAKNERRILKKLDAYNGYSLYLGIPFCPTTCLYCSFTSYPIVGARKQGKVEKYLEALKKEIRETKSLLMEAGKSDKRFLKSPTSVYFGGGTPTSLNSDELDDLLGELINTFDLEETYEFTVEAGRPDSIDLEKLQVLKKHGVNRISINPQTMNDNTLKLIGRNHTRRDLLDAFVLARNCGFENINMDIILGLPNEGKDEVIKTLEDVKSLNPDCLTVHSLAIKRAARLNTEKKKYESLSIDNDVDFMEMASEAAISMAMNPYYMYRQQNMAGNLENIGFAKWGKESLYNILIMEEIQPIIALGAGASSKFIYDNEDGRPGKRIERAENVKDVDEYINRIDEMILRKNDRLNGGKYY